jgi:lysophospholipase L1-like esterase
MAHGRGQARAVIARRKKEALPKAVPGANGLLVAEGDSWFDYPFYDVLERLEDRFNFQIESVAHKGDTVEEMAYDVTQLSKLARTFEHVAQAGKAPRAILLSGGGNDIAGDEFAMLLNHSSSGLTPLNSHVVTGVIDERIRFAMVSVISAATELSREHFGTTVPVVIHGYAYPVPDGRGYLGGFWVLPGPWLEPGFRRKGYLGLDQRIQLMMVLIDRFNEVLKSIPAEPGLRHVVYLDLRKVLSNALAGGAYKHSWENELHPTKLGFQAVAQKFRDFVLTFPKP